MAYYRHRYVEYEGLREGLPLGACPLCGSCLTKEEGVTILFSNGREHGWEEPGRLDGEGNLVDDTGLVAKGLHADTLCSGCGRSLAAWEVWD